MLQKANDLGGIGIELVQRKGTGNYDKDRTIFNYSYVPLSKPTLQEQVYSKLKDNKIYYNDSKNTNLLNGAIVTSGKEFFQSLGMKFKESNRTHQVGKDKGKPILVPDIKSKEDIPKKVMDFFDDSYKFLEKLVGKDNIVYAEIHFDEDTPHLQFYFIPVVNEVKRKVFETDTNGNIIYREGIDKKGNKKMYPIQKKERDIKIQEQQQTISKQKSIIKEKNSIIEKLEEKVNEIQETFNNFKEKMFNFCDKICRALGHKIGIHFSKNSDINYDDMEYYANDVNRKYEQPEKDKSDDFDISI